jgi:hypothetical protein
MQPGTPKKRHSRPPADLYSWEKDRENSVREAGEAEDCVTIMLRRIAMSDPDQKALKGDPAQHKHLVSFGMEVHLNIAWYVTKMKEQERQRRVFQIGICLLAFLGLCAIPIFWTLGKESHNDWNLIFFQLTAFPAAGFGILRVLSSMTDTRCRLGIFWCARSGLGEILYLFEHKWQGQFAAARLPEFWADIDAGITNARQITRDERQKFFDSMVSVSDALSSTQQAVAGVSGLFQGAPGPRRPPPPAVAEPPEIAPPT